MGRKKMYFTEDEIKQANKEKSRRYYKKYAEKIKKRRMEKYYDNIQSKKQKE